MRLDHAKHKYVRHPGVEIMGEMGGRCGCKGRNAVFLPVIFCLYSMF